MSKHALCITFRKRIFLINEEQVLASNERISRILIEAREEKNKWPQKEIKNASSRRKVSQRQPIVQWLVKPGDSVKRYDPLMEVVSDKVTTEVPSDF